MTMSFPNNMAPPIPYLFKFEDDDTLVLVQPSVSPTGNGFATPTTFEGAGEMLATLTRGQKLVRALEQTGCGGGCTCE